MVSERYTKSHLAKVVCRLKEFQPTPPPATSGELIESSKRALERAAAITREDEARHRRPGHIGSTARSSASSARPSASSTPSPA